MADDAKPDEARDGDRPTAKQLLHWATGDRQAEGHALADAAGEHISDDDGERAVRRAHGDLGRPADERLPDAGASSDVATVADAEHEHDDA